MKTIRGPRKENSGDVLDTGFVSMAISTEFTRRACMPDYLQERGRWRRQYGFVATFYAIKFRAWISDLLWWRIKTPNGWLFRAKRAPYFTSMKTWQWALAVGERESLIQSLPKSYNPTVVFSAEDQRRRPRRCNLAHLLVSKAYLGSRDRDPKHVKTLSPPSCRVPSR